MKKIIIVLFILTIAFSAAVILNNFYVSNAYAKKNSSLTGEELFRNQTSYLLARALCEDGLCSSEPPESPQSSKPSSSISSTNPPGEPREERCGSKQCDGGGCHGDVDCNSGKCKFGQCAPGDGDGGDGGGGGGGGGGAPAPTVIPAPTCAAGRGKSASIEPNYVLPGDDVIVKCGYGEDILCMSIVGGSLTNCSMRTYVNNETVWACKAGYIPGTYTDAKCVLTAGTGKTCCVGSGGEKPIGQYSILTTAAHFVQRVRVPTGSYVLTVRYQTVISKGSGAFVDLLCANPDCGGGKKENDSLISIPLPLNTDFETRSVPVTIPADGDKKDYRIRIVAGEGSELYVDMISFSGGGIEYVLNGEFKTVRGNPNSINLTQPNDWGDADNKLGFYYGRAINAKIPPVSAPLGGVESSSSSQASGSAATAVKLAMKLKFQGITAKPKSSDPINVKVKLGGKLLSAQTAYQTVKFTVDDKGIWSGSADFTVPQGEGYQLFVKGPKHLQKKICDAAPAESAGGTYHCSEGKISLKAGENTVDASKILLLVGDLPDKGSQNGVTDSYETAYVRQHLQSTKTDELSVADVNLDGVIDGQDFSLVLASLSIKYDEE